MGRPADAHPLTISEEVAAALDAGRPVVALESTLISHGLPHPENLAVARESEAAVRAGGAVPATVAVGGGRIRVGLGPAELEELAASSGVRKVSRSSLASALAEGALGATTVSATMVAAHLAGIRVFATGGIGGVHRGAFGGGPGAARAPTLDVSADLDELARTPVAVVCAGPKAILDVPATLEYLETRGVPVVTIGSPELPGFYSARSEFPSPLCVDDLDAVVRLVEAHFVLGMGSGVLVCVPVPVADELPRETAVQAVEQALSDADELGMRGEAVTPWLLGRVAQLTAGASVRANRSLILNNARVGGQLAVRLEGGRGRG